MEILEITTSDKILEALKKHERSKSWLAKQMGLTRQTLYLRFRDDSWKIGEVYHLKHLIGIE